MKHVLAFLFIFFPFFAAAENLPVSLFGIEVGKTYNLGEGNNKGDLPVKNFRGVSKFWGEGINYYFEPLKKYSAFPYIENKEDGNSEYYETSFRLYLHPVVDERIENLKQFYEVTRYNVDLIEWSQTKNTQEEGYLWAFSMCEKFSADIAKAPIVRNDYNEEYSCVFEGDNAVLMISGSERVYLTLRTTDSRFEANSMAVRKLRLKLEFDDIEPY